MVRLVDVRTQLSCEDAGAPYEKECHGARCRHKKAGTLFRSTGIQSGEFWSTPVCTPGLYPSGCTSQRLNPKAHETVASRGDATQGVHEDRVSRVLPYLSYNKYNYSLPYVPTL